MAGILDDPRRQVDGTFRLVIECDEPFHEGQRVLATISRWVENPDADELLGAWWWFPSLYPREECGPGDFAVEDVLPGGVAITDITGGELVSTSDNFDNTEWFLDLQTREKQAALIEHGSLETHQRIQLKCPNCGGFDVQLNVTRLYPDTHIILECPTLDKISAAGMKRISLRFLAHAVSYGVS